MINQELYNTNSVKIIDPLSGVIASKSAFKIEEIKQTFFEVFDFLQKKKALFDDKVKMENNLIYELLKD